jgi:hypothetical protein
MVENHLGADDTIGSGIRSLRAFNSVAALFSVGRED